MEYYSKLNMEVEKSKMHTEWKIKRLQLDQSRMQLISTEERNLKREKLELEHQKNEEVMAMSIQSDMLISIQDVLDSKEESVSADRNTVDTEPCHRSSSVISEQVEESADPSEFDNNKLKSQSSGAVFSVLCNTAKNFFGVTKSNENEHCDNNKELDAQGNVVQSETDVKSRTLHTQSSSEIGSKLDDDYDNLQYQKGRKEALLNKQKVMSHEFGSTDKENNQLKDPPLIQVASIDEENNLQEWSPFVEAKLNKLRVLGTEYNVDILPVKPSEPKTDAQREALANKKKVLGVEYNLPAAAYVKREPANKAQEEAVRNKEKILHADFDMLSTTTEHPKKDNSKRSTLTLNLRPYGETASSTYRLGVTPNAESVTPGEYFPRVSSCAFFILHFLMIVKLQCK